VATLSQVRDELQQRLLTYLYRGAECRATTTTIKTRAPSACSLKSTT